VRDERHTPGSPLAEVFLYFARLGVIAFGGPAAHIALMRRELVVQRRWMSDAEFVDHLGVTNLVPGPNSTELAMHMGASRAGWRGLWLGGLAFIVPACAITLVLAWAYVRYGDTPGGEALLFGIAPVILAIIVQAIWGLRAAAVKGPATLIVLAAGVGLALAGAGELPIILGSGAVLLVLGILTGGRAVAPWPAKVQAAARGVSRRVLRLPTWLTGQGIIAAPPLGMLPWAVGPLGAVATSGVVAQAAGPAGSNLGELFLVFVKIGSVLYGSGYVLVSFMETEFVTHRGWLTQQQLVDAVAVGQFTPGPVFSAAAFAGYVVGGWPGGILAAAGIFLPSFVFVTLTHPLVPRLRGSPWAAPFLDGVNAAALALMAVVTVRLARDVLDNPWQVGLFAGAAIVLVRFSPNSAWVVLAGAAAGIVHRLLI
jgi:chromate transporter